MVDQTWMAAFGFTSADLTANRAGRLSEAQAARLRRLRTRTIAVTAAIVGVLVMAAAAFLFIGRQNDQIVLQIAGISLTVVNAVVITYGVASAHRLGRDIDGGVEPIIGTAARTLRLVNRVPTYIITLNGQEVPMPKAAFALIADGVPITVYRAPATRTLLSAERA